MIKVFVGSFNADKITVGAGFPVCGIFRKGFFADAQRDGNVKFFNFGQYRLEPFRRKPQILARLHDDSLKPVFANGAGSQRDNLFRTHPVTLQVAVVSTQPAVEAVVFADV